MDPELQSITFNISPGDLTQPSITLRRNAAEPVTIPEWRRRETNAPLDSPVAYSIARARNGQVSIRVRMRGPAGRTFNVRALGPDWLEQFQLGCIYSVFYWLLPISRWQQLTVLGDVPPFIISFPQTAGGEKMTEAEVTVTLRHTIGNLGIWISNMRWRWEFSEGFGLPWRYITDSTHRVYCIADHSTAPWRETDPASSNRNLPWVDALEVACLWAAGSREMDAILRALVRGVWDAGSRGLLRYGNIDGAFTIGGGLNPLNLTEFVRHIRTGTTARSVQCYDCAAVVSTLANLLGLNVEQYAFNFASERTALLIGHSRPSEIFWTEHEVARIGTGSATRVWDACAQYNAGSSSDPRRFVARAVYGMSFPEFRPLLSDSGVAFQYNGRRDVI